MPVTPVRVGQVRDMVQLGQFGQLSQFQGSVESSPVESVGLVKSVGPGRSVGPVG